MPNLTTLLDNLPAYLAIATAVAVVLGTIGLALSKAGTALIATPYAPVRAVGHVVFFVGDMLTSIFSHWPDIAASLGNLAKALKPKVPPSAGLGVLMLSALLLTGCPSVEKTTPKTPTELGAESARVSKVAYGALALVVQSLYDIEAGWMHANTATGDPGLADAAAPTARKITDGLDQATAVLADVRSLLSNGADEATVRKRLKDALPLVKDAMAFLNGVGRPVPDKVADALSFLDGFLGGAS